jgi:hypothetical protein
VSLDNRDVMRLLAGLVFDYLSWTQLVPMLAMLGFGFGMIAALLIIGNQEQSLDMLGRFVEWLYTLPWLGDYLLERAAQTDDTLKLSGEDLRSLVLNAWLWGSLGCTLIGALANRLFGPFQPMRYGTRIWLATGLALAVLVGFIAVFLSERGFFSGGSGNWAFTFGGITVLVFLVSVWSLSATYVIGLLRRALLAEPGEPARRADNDEAGGAAR